MCLEEKDLIVPQLGDSTVVVFYLYFFKLKVPFVSAMEQCFREWVPVLFVSRVHTRTCMRYTFLPDFMLFC